MGTYTLITLNTNIETTVSQASGIKRAQDLNEITKNIPFADLPLLQVYPDKWQSPRDSEVAKNTFGGGNQPLQIFSPVYNLDVYIAKLTVFAESMTKYAQIAQALTEVFEAQVQRPLFGDSEDVIQNFSWEAERVIFEYSQEKFLGIRCQITLYVY